MMSASVEKDSSTLGLYPAPYVWVPVDILPKRIDTLVDIP